MAAEDTPFRGVLYAGLMCEPDGSLAVIEFNCRFGDPEAQVVLPAVNLDLADHCWRIASGDAWTAPATVPAARAVVTTVVAAAGYPDAPEKGAAIPLPETLPDDTLLFHAGTVHDDDGMLRSNGGRVLCATGIGTSVSEAAARSRDLAAAVAFPGAQFRRDIAWREVARAGAA
jgi:phosphoribosylamine--glycine ligase